MVAVKQRIGQYNKEVGQPRGGLLPPKLMTVTPIDDGSIVDAAVENVSGDVVGTAVDYLTRLAGITDEPTWANNEDAAVWDVFGISLRGAERIAEMTDYMPAFAEARSAVLSLNTHDVGDGKVSFILNDVAARAACRLATYDVGARSNPGFYNPATSQIVPDETTVAHVLSMVERVQATLNKYGPVTSAGFVFASTKQRMFGEPGGYTDLVTHGDGDFLTPDTLWDCKVTKTKTNKDATLQVLMYFLMGKQSELPVFESLTHIGIINPRLNTVERIAVEEIPADIIDTVRYDVIGYDQD